MFLYVISLILATGVCVAGIQAGSTGGKVRHTEIGTANAMQVPAFPKTQL